MTLEWSLNSKHDARRPRAKDLVLTTNLSSIHDLSLTSCCATACMRSNQSAQVDGSTRMQRLRMESRFKFETSKI
jgi:hypothetical protein